MNNFIPNIKTSYSFRKSTIAVDDIIEYAVKNSIESLMICDENMFGVKEFYDKCRKNSISPVIGLDAVFSCNGEKYRFYAVAKDSEGYRELMSISTDHEFRKDIPIDEHIGSSHLYFIASPLPAEEKSTENSDPEKFTEMLKNLREEHSEAKSSLYLGYYEGIDERTVEAARNASIPVCYFNSARSIYKDDLKALSLINDDDFAFNETEYVQTENENIYMSETKKIMDSCDVSIEKSTGLPDYSSFTDAEADSNRMFFDMVKKGFNDKLSLKKKKNSEYLKRVNTELKTIVDMGFADYFLIVHDYIKYAKDNGIVVGPGRGSAAGSLVAYCLGITEIDPVEYSLLFERFLNRDRISMPDIDVDFESGRRSEIIQYIKDRYGSDRVAQIVTFSTYGCKVALRDVCSKSGLSDAYNSMSRYIDSKTKSFVELYSTSAGFKNAVDKYPELKDSLHSIDVISRMPRQMSTHAAGIVISSENLRDTVPLSRTANDVTVTQYSKDYIESIGLIKMDILSLNNLDLIREIQNNINIDRDSDNLFDYSKIPLDDSKTFELLRNADTYGVFQLESQGMKNALRKIRCTSFNDLVAAVALFRPGPMENIEPYANRKNGREKTVYEFEELEPILKDTYGIMIYQEQLMKTVTDLADFSLSEADTMRKAISKKDEKIMSALKEKFVTGCERHSRIPKEKSLKIFRMMEKFANYGFNKSHAVSYGRISYMMAYLKTNYPKEFYTAVFSHTHDVSNCLKECQKKNIRVLNPSINSSADRFTVTEEGILFSLKGIANIGDVMCERILEERRKNGPFKSVLDLLERVDMDSRTYDALADSGALDEFGYNRTTLKNNFRSIREFAENRNLFGIDDDDFVLVEYDDSQRKVSELERNSLGVYLSQNPALVVKNSLSKANISDISEASLRKNPELIGYIESLREFTSRNNEMMCKLTLTDDTGSISCTVFSRQYREFLPFLEKGKLVCIKGKYQNDPKYGESIIVGEISEPQKKENDNAISKQNSSAKKADPVKPEAAKNHTEKEII